MVRHRKQPWEVKPFVTILLVVLGIGVLLFLPPSSIFIILGYILLLATGVFFITTFFTKNKLTHVLAFLFALLFLTSNAIAGFNLLNTLLLLSFIIGIRLLFK